MEIPKQYLPVMPYLIIRNANAFLDFAKEVFEAKEQLIVPRSEGIVMHGEMRINDAVIMFADATEQFAEKTAGMFLYIENVDAVYEKALMHGAKSTMAPTAMEYGYSGGFEDAFGNQWWIAEPGTH